MNVPRAQESAGHAQRAVRNAGLSLGGLVVGTAVLVVATPYLLNGLGPEGYGIFSLALAVSGVLGILDLGMGPAVIRELAVQGQDTDDATVAGITQTAIAMALLLGTAGLLVCWVMAPSAAVWLGLPVAARPVAIRALRASGFVLAARMAVSVMNAVLIAYQRFEILTLFTLMLPVVSTLAALAVVLNGGNASTAVIAAGAGSLFSLAAEWLVVKRTFPAVNLLPRLDSRVLRHLWHFSWVTFLIQICALLVLQADKFIVSRIVGVTAVGDYSVIFAMGYRIQVVLAALAAVVFPLTSALARPEDRRRAIELYAEALRLTTLAGLLLLLPVLTLSHVFLSLWISPEFSDRLFRVFALLACSSFLLGIAVVPFHVINGLGLPRQALTVWASVLTVSIGANLVLAPRYGLMGSGVAALLATIPAAVQIRLAENALGAGGVGARLAQRALVVLGLVFPLGIWMAGRVPYSWAGLIGQAALVDLAVVAVATATGLCGKSDTLLIVRAISGRHA